MMHMTFYWGKDVTILFDFWRVRTWPGYLISLVVVALAAAAAEWLAGQRSKVGGKEKAGKDRERGEGGESVPLLLARGRSASTASRTAVCALYALQTALGYLLMLAAMSFNGGVFVAIVVGFAVGHAMFRGSDNEPGSSRSEGACGAC